jgi:hypothetical protein
MSEGYCVKCKEKVKMLDIVEKKTKVGSIMMRDKCPECGTTVCCFRKKKEGE